MNKCLNCGKEIPKGKKFCNHQCSAKYNNVRRIRQPWTKAQRARVQKQRYCKYCGKPLDRYSGEFVTCKDCGPFVGGLPVQLKLGFTSGSLESRDRKAFEVLSKMYFEEGLGVNDIAYKTGIRHISLMSLFRRHGIQKIRTVSEGVHTSYLTGKLQVPYTTHARGRTGYHTSWEGITFRYRSLYEDRYASELDSLKVSYLYEKVRIEYFDTVQSKYRVAVPDFYLQDSNELVEIKSVWTLKGKVQEMKDKFKAYREHGYTPKLVLEGVERNLDDIEEH